MKFNSLINTFTSGEWSPKMRARSDAEEYSKSCETLINFIPRIQGGAFRRPGTVKVNLGGADDTDLQNAIHNFVPIASKLIPIILGNGQKRILFANQAFPTTEWLTLDGANGSAIGNPTVTGLANFAVNARNIKYASVGDLTFLCNSEGTAPVRVWRPIGAAGDLIKLDEIPASIFSYQSVPYLDINAGGSAGVDLTASAATGAITIAASVAFWSAQHVGAYIKMSSAGVTGVAKITGFVSTTSVNATVITAVPTIAVGTAATTSWEESAWSNYRGWPKYVTTYQGRLIFANEYKVWGSRIGNVLDFMERPLEQDPDFAGYTDDNSRPFTLLPDTGNSGPIRNLTAGKTLVVLCERGEVIGYGTNGALGPNDVSFESSGSFGSGIVSADPVRVNNYLSFVQRGGRRLRDLVFNNDESQFKSTDLSFVADHLTLDPEAKTSIGGALNESPVDPIVELAGTEVESSYIWAKTQAGRLLCLTVDRDYKINAWSQAILGGKTSDRTYPKVKSICSIPFNDQSQDRLYMIVERFVDGNRRAFLEYIDIPMEYAAIPTNSTMQYNMEYVHMDMKQVYDSFGTPVTTVPTASYFEGETFQVVADGQYVGEKVVDSSGNITLDDPAEYIIVGYKTPAKLKTSPIELGNQVPNSPQGLIKRIDEVLIKFFLTYGAKYGTIPSRMLSIDFKDPAAPMNQTPTLFTGIKVLKTEGLYERETQVTVETDSPFSCNILAIISKGITYD